MFALAAFSSTMRLKCCAPSSIDAVAVVGNTAAVVAAGVLAFGGECGSASGT